RGVAQPHRVAVRRRRGRCAAAGGGAAGAALREAVAGDVRTLRAGRNPDATAPRADHRDRPGPPGGPLEGPGPRRGPHRGAVYTGRSGVTARLRRASKTAWRPSGWRYTTQWLTQWRRVLGSRLSEVRRTKTAIVLRRHAHCNVVQAMAGSSHGLTPDAWTGVI